jgi:LysR family transcriptional activator of nhaA
MFNYNHLYYFYVTAKLKGVTVAARQLNTSQPSLSSQIKNLESTLKRKLFRKRGRNIELTEDGKRVYNFCRRMFEVSDELADFISGETTDLRVNLKIGVSPELERPFIARIISAALKQKEGESTACVSMFSRMDEQMRISLKLHQLDLLISNSPIYDDEIKVIASLDMPVALVAAPALAAKLGLCQRASIDENLQRAAKKFILPTGSLKLRQEVDVFLQGKGIKPHMLFESDIMASVVRNVCEGLGVGFAPIPYIKSEIKEGLLRVYPLNEFLWIHRLTVMSGPNLKPHPVVARLVEVIHGEEISAKRQWTRRV